jgi:AcrR family transcriptional regulator
MLSADLKRVERRAHTRAAARAGILDAARRVAKRDGAGNLSLRGVAAEAGFAPAALYVYFRSKDELLLALAADDLACLAQAMRLAKAADGTSGRLHAAATVALDLLVGSETLAAAGTAFTPATRGADVERAFNGRLIAALMALQAATGADPRSRDSQLDAIVLGAALTGLAVFARSGRVKALGFTVEELVTRLIQSFPSSTRA